MPQRYSYTGRAQAHPYDILFGPIRMGAEGPEAPRPIVLRAWVERDALLADLLVMGEAMAWGEAAAAALAAGLAGGVALHLDSRMRVVIDVERIEHRRVSGITVPDATTFASFHFRSPICVRQGGRANLDPIAVPRAAVRRVTAMAKWHGVALRKTDDAVRSALDNLRLDTRNLMPYRFQRHSRRQGNTPIPVSGHLGTLRIEGNLGPLAPYFALADTCNIGSHAGLGLGWTEISILQ